MAPTEQKALFLDKAGAPFAFRLGTLPIPTPGNGEILIKIHTAALNPADAILAQTGLFIRSWPYVLGSDGSGVVEELGEGVTGYAVGDRVMIFCGFTVHTFQEYVVAKAEMLTKIPDHITLEQGSTITTTLCTATFGLYGAPGAPHGGAGLTPPWREGGRNKYTDEAILVIGAASNVGRNAMQLARMSGFNPIIAVASSHNEAYCKAAGATHIIDYRKTPYGPAFTEALKSILGSKPLKFIQDSVTSEETQLFAWSILAPGGRLCVATPFPSEKLGPAGVEDKDGRRVCSAGGLDFSILPEMLGAIGPMLTSGDLKPCEIEVLEGGLNGVGEGVTRLAEKKVSGKKLVVRIGDTA